MDENPYQSPESSSEPPPQLRTFKVGRHSLIVAMAGAIGIVTGSVACLQTALNNTWLNGGVPVQVSSGGRVFFLVLGGFAGAASAGIAVGLAIAANERLDRRLAGIIAFVTGCIGGVAVFFVMGFVFITVPEEVFDFLTD